jgi:regulator of protease activity HflC (stomatin/prohibitin superfamily)
MNTPSRELAYPHPWPGIPMLLLFALWVPANITGIVFGGLHLEAGRFALGLPLLLGSIVALLGSILILTGLVLVNPNHSKVAVLFGRYRGTMRQPGLFWINPFAICRAISLRAHNFNSDKLKVNDLRGNPIEIGAVVVWRVRDTAQAAFDVEDHESYVEVQTESAVRHLASAHPYDEPGDDETSLRGSSDSINSELQQELEQRLQMAGIEVIEARISHLAYAPEIAGAMLQRQQAEAIIDARKRIVEGATSMVQMAIENLQQGNVVALDEERKAQMVSNLLVVLCSDRGTQPVVNAGTLYG